MDVVDRKPKIYIMAGKARHGKNTVADIIRDYAEERNISYINLAYADYIKEYAKKISNWDGSEETKPRELLQQLGTDIIRKNLGDEFFIKKLMDDIKVYSYFFDIITISDARFPKEIDIPKSLFDNVYGIHIVRPNFDNGLTEEQKAHPTEVALDNYSNYDYEIVNDGTIDELRKKVVEVLFDE